MHRQPSDQDVKLHFPKRISLPLPSQYHYPGTAIILHLSPSLSCACSWVTAVFCVWFCSALYVWNSPVLCVSAVCFSLCWVVFFGMNDTQSVDLFFDTWVVSSFVLLWIIVMWTFLHLSLIDRATHFSWEFSYVAWSWSWLSKFSGNEWSNSRHNHMKETALEQTYRADKDVFIDLKVFSVPSAFNAKTCFGYLVNLSGFTVFPLLWTFIRINKARENNAVNSHVIHSVSTLVSALPTLLCLSS